MRHFLAVAACLIAVTTAEAQVYRFKSYTSNTGLPSNSVYSIFQDSQGYIWFATDAGASRYDGGRFTTFTSQQGLVDPSVRAFVEDRSGHIWILTKGGLSRYDGTHFASYTTAQGLVHDEVRCGLRARDGALWFGTSKGISRYDGSRFTSYGEAQGLPAAPVWSLLEDRAGSLWVGLRGGGLARLEGSRFKLYGRAEGLPDEKVFALAEDPAGGIWLATDNGLAHYDGRHFRTYTTADGMGSNHASSVLVDKYGRVWCGTFGGGLSRLEEGRFTVFNRRNGLPDDYLTGILKDSEGNFWFATLWTGAFRFGGEQFTNYMASNILAEGLISGIAEARDGSLWFASINNGLASLDPRGVARIYGVKDGLLEERLWTLFIDSRGRIWVGGSKGVSWYENGRFRRFTLEQLGAQDRINAIVEDGRGRIWFGSGAATSNGVIVYDGRGFTRYSTENGLVHNQVNSLSADRGGSVWICTEDGLTRFDGERFTAYRSSEGLPSKRTIVAHEDEQGRFWVGTTSGLALFDGGSFKTYGAEQGLENNYVHALTSRGGVLWIGTAGGVSAFDGKAFRNYTTKDGLISHEISTGTALSRPDGSVWFGTPEGVVRYQPVKETTEPRAPRVHVSAIQVGDRALEPARSLSLRHGQNSLTFEFLGLSFIDEASVRYSYLLRGFDADWSLPSSERSVRFTNLPPGRYQFLVKARSAAGLWSEPEAVEIAIRPPYWRTWWFLLTTLSLAGGLTYSGYTWRIRRLETQHRQRLTSLRDLLESIRAINSELDLPSVLQNIATESARLVGGEPGGIGLVEENRVVFRRIWLQPGWEPYELTFRLGEGIAGRVAATGRTSIVNDPRSDPDVRFPQLIEGLYAHGFMDVPIIERSGRVVGVLEVRRRPLSPPFGEGERQMLESLAHQAAIAMENAGLYGDLEEKKVLLAESLWAAEELYRNEQQMTRMLQEVNLMKTNFMIVTSHEMRTPLTLLRGYHEALLAGYMGTLAPPQERSLNTCQRTTERMIASFNDILEMLQIEEKRVTLRPEPLDLEKTVEQVLGDLAPFVERRGQRVAIEDASGLPRVMADAEKMRVVLLNLLQNAIKFTPDGGEIKVRFSSGPEAVRLTVEDSGIGIDPAELDRIFDKFYTGRDSLHHTSGTYQFEARGSGLGLAIAKGHVEAHGGRIWAESEGPGTGSRFHVVIPTVGAPGAITVEATVAES